MPSTPLRLFAALMLGAALGTASAHGPTRQKVVEQVTIDAPADKVWAVVGNFDSLKNWHPAVQSSAADHGNDADSQRLVTLKSGGTLSERLEAYDAAKMKYSYRAKDGGALPVTNYTSTVSVKAEGAKSIVEWRGAFYRGHPNNDPPPELNDEAAVKAVTEVYQAGLANLKALVEKR